MSSERAALNIETAIEATAEPAQSAACESVSGASSRHPHIPRSSGPLERWLIQRLWQHIGQPPVVIELHDGWFCGSKSGSIGTIRIGRPSVLRRLCFQASLAFGEAFSDGDLTIEGDLIEVFETLNRHLAQRRPHSRWQSLWKLLSPPRHGHSLRQSKAAVHHHYDLGNDFYKLWLDRQLVYTCAYFERPEMSLEEAQAAKLDYVCRKLRLRPGETVVEAGCGWGALALHMARHYGVKVQAFNLSHEQIIYARELARKEGLHSQVEFIEDDYRNIRGTFDVFASVGMLEHVGRENYPAFGRLMDRVLNAEGRGLIHSIGRNAPAPLDPWTEKYIFPGAYPPALTEMLSLFPEAGFSVLDVENLRLHYAATCRAWLNRFDAASEQVAATFDERFVRLWRLYLAASAAAFLSGDLQLFQVLFARGTSNRHPLTRSDWYSPQGR